MASYSNNSSETSPNLSLREDNFFCHEQNVPFYDCILLAKNNVKVYASRTTLAMHSKVFRELLRSTHQSGEYSRHGAEKRQSDTSSDIGCYQDFEMKLLPKHMIIPLPEHKCELLNLLLCHLMFPWTPPIDDSARLEEILLLADKFDMPYLTHQLEDHMCHPQFLQSSTFTDNITRWALLSERLRLINLWSMCEYTLARLDPSKFYKMLQNDEFKQLSKENILKVVTRHYVHAHVPRDVAPMLMGNGDGTPTASSQVTRRLALPPPEDEIL